jgi:hypothetical protein
MIITPESAAALQGGQIRHLLHHAKLGLVAGFVQAYPAELVFRKGAARSARPDFLASGSNGIF